MKPLSAVTAFGESQRAELMARIVSKAASGTSGPVRGELLSALLSDTANLTQFIRYSGLSEEAGAALLRDAMGETAKAVQFSARSMGGIADMLSGVRPTATGVDASYGATASFGGTGSEPLHLTENSIGGKSTGIQFTSFSPGQADFDRTIDNIGPSSDIGENPEPASHFIGIPLQKPDWEGVQLARTGLYLILAGLAGAIMLGTIVFVN
ncbi:MAG: hypothetical protein K8F90_10095 [Hyphomicrobiales bacterium]|nr:hypothetical protein [Hyphomicrobiales bacterium]